MELNTHQKKRVIMLVDIDPVPKPRMTRADKWKKRPCVMRYRQFADELRQATKDETFGNQLLLEFHIEMPKSWSRKKLSEMNGKPHQSRPDLDNLIKTLDAIFPEDSSIYDISATKFWAEKGRIKIENK